MLLALEVWSILDKVGCLLPCLWGRLFLISGDSIFLFKKISNSLAFKGFLTFIKWLHFDSAVHFEFCCLEQWVYLKVYLNQLCSCFCLCNWNCYFVGCHKKLKKEDHIKRISRDSYNNLYNCAEYCKLQHMGKKCIILIIVKPFVLKLFQLVIYQKAPTDSLVSKLVLLLAY